MAASSDATASKLDEAKRLAAYKAVDENVTDKMVLGVGSGSTIVFAITRLIERVKSEGLDVVCIPTSFQSTQLLLQGGMRVGTLTEFPTIDVAIDGADEMDSNFHCIKGGGGCALQEKLVAYNAKTFIVVADYRKNSTVLGTNWTQGVPVDVIPSAYTAVANKIRALGGTPTLRMAVKKAGPVVTDNGHLILDCVFPNELMADPPALDARLQTIPGVVETGLFVDLACKAYFGNSDGSVTERAKA